MIEELKKAEERDMKEIKALYDEALALFAYQRTLVTKDYIEHVDAQISAIKKDLVHVEQLYREASTQDKISGSFRDSVVQGMRRNIEGLKNAIKTLEAHRNHKGDA